jgi:hypothetical protein
MDQIVTGRGRVIRGGTPIRRLYDSEISTQTMIMCVSSKSIRMQANICPFSDSPSRAQFCPAKRSFRARWKGREGASDQPAIRKTRMGPHE